jgi:hypothetical protein
MPLTPFHWGPGSWIGLVLFKRIDFPTFLAGCVVLDIEPFLVIVLGLDSRLHGYSHTFLFGSLIALILAYVMFKLKRPVQKIMTFFKLQQNLGFSSFVISALLGAWSHILLDAPLYSDIRPFFPLTANPLYQVLSHNTIYGFCSLSFILGLFAYFYIIIKARNTK